MTRAMTRKQPKTYGMTTAEVFHHLPGNSHVMTSFVWQDYDRAPDYPEFFRFIADWQEQLDGLLHSVRLTQSRPDAQGSTCGEVRKFALH